VVREILSKPRAPADVPSLVRSYLDEAFYALDDRSASRGAQTLAAMAAGRTKP